jgi:hypothetical protein
MKRRDLGHAIVEMLLLGVALALALLVPVSGGQPIAAVLLDALLGFLRAQSYLISIL